MEFIRIIGKNTGGGSKSATLYLTNKDGAINLSFSVPAENAKSAGGAR